MADVKTPTFLPNKGTLRLYGLCIFFGLGSFLWGYNIGIIATIYVNPGFIKALHTPTASQKGLITAIYYLGTWTSYVFLSGWVSDKLGRRYAALTGTVVTCVGAAFQTGASGHGAFAMMVVGRIIAGFGNAIISTSVPLYQSEIAPAKKRGGLVVMNHIGMVTGLSAAFWVGYGTSFWTHGAGKTEAWRLSVAVQYIPALLFCIGLPFLPETPRWLLEKGQPLAARKSLTYLRGCDDEPQAIEAELNEIKFNIEMHTSIEETSWKVLFTDRDLFARLWRVALLQFMAQMCGATAIKYYLPTLFIQLGLSTQLSLLASGIESTLKIGCTIMEMLLVDRLGRRGTLILGAVIMSIALLINGALPQAYPHDKHHKVNKAADYTCVVFIFFFSFGYSVGFGPNAWVYGTEVFPTYIRAKGLNLAASAGAIGSIVVAQVWPVAIANIGSKTYYIFMSINIACLILLIIFYPETKGKTLEEMDSLFGRLNADTESSSPGVTSPEREAYRDAEVEEQAVTNVAKD